MGLTHLVLPTPQLRFPNPVARTSKPYQKFPLSHTPCSISKFPTPNPSSLSATTKTLFRVFTPLSKITKPEANNFPTMSEIMEASKSQKIGLEIQSVGPFFRITARSLKTQKELGRAEGLVRVWLGAGKILHLDSIRLRRETLGMERSIFGIGLFVGAVAIRYGYDCGCGKAELLAINDSELYHSKGSRHKQSGVIGRLFIDFWMFPNVGLSWKGVFLLIMLKAVEATNEVNQWAEKETNGLIKEVLPSGSVDVSTRLVFANALYFKGAWTAKFDASKTKDKEFYLLNGSSVQVPFMTSKMQ